MKKSEKRADRSPRRASRLLALAAALALGTTAASANAQTGTQLTVDSNKNLAQLDGGVSSIVFTGAYALTLSDGQTLTPIFLNQASGAVLNLGGGSATGQSWRVASNSPRWTGTFAVGNGNELVVDGAVANPLGAFSTDGTSAFGTVELQNGATLTVEDERVAPPGGTSGNVGASGSSSAANNSDAGRGAASTTRRPNVETRIGSLRTSANAS